MSDSSKRHRQCKKKTKPPRQYSLSNIFIIGGILITLVFCIISTISTINIIKAEKTVDAHSRLENQIFFPLTRAIEEIYTSLADLQTQFTRKHTRLNAEQFKWNMESAMASLEQAQKAIAELLTSNTDIITAVSETKRAAILFQESGIRALVQTDRLYSSMKKTENKIREITEWTKKFFLTITGEQTKGSGTELRNAAYSCNVRALDTLAEARITYLKLCTLFYQNISLFHSATSMPSDDTQWERLFRELDNFSKAYPDLSGRVLFLKEELKTLRANMKDVFAAATAASAAIEKANNLADELGINLELCRQAIAATNMEIQRETNNLRHTMAISLASALLFYILAAVLTGAWVRKNILKPLHHFNAAIKRIADGDDHITLETPALKEISTIAQSFNIMTERLREREQGLQEARQKWETVFRAIGGPAMVLSTDYTITECNERLAEVLSPDDDDPDKGSKFRGKKCYDVICHNNREGHNCPVRSMLLEKLKDII